MIKKIIILCSGLIFLTFSSGCWVLVGAAAGGAGTAAWLGGKLSDQVNASHEGTVIATEKALHSLKMDITKKTETEQVTQIRSEYTDGSDVWIDIKPISDKTSKIEIRVGITGNKDISVKILERIKTYL